MVTNIEEFNPAAKLIAMLRNPTEMFVSLRNQPLTNYWEDQRDPETAWRLQEKRADGRAMPPLNKMPGLLLYGAVCRLGEQVERLPSVFSQETGALPPL